MITFSSAEKNTATLKKRFRIILGIFRLCEKERFKTLNLRDLQYMRVQSEKSDTNIRLEWIKVQ